MAAMKQWVVLSVLIGVASANDACGGLEKEVKELKQKLSAAEAKIGTLQGEVDSAISVIGIISHTGSLAGDSLKSLLDKTDIDDTVYDQVCTHLGTAKQMTVDFLGKVSNLDYNEHWNTVTQHDVYKTHVAPHVDTLHKSAQPIMKEHVYPALDTAHAAVRPHLETASKHINENVYPTLQRGHAMVFEHADLNALTTKLGSVLDPAFVAATKAVPKASRFFPAEPLDRLLFVVVAIIGFYYFLLTTYFLVKKAFAMTKFSTSLAVQLCIVFPLWVLWRLIRLVLCVTTCGFCCGLCWRKPKTDAAKPAKNPKTNGANGATNGAGNGATKVTVDEVTTLMDGSKKSGKTEEGAKFLTSYAVSGKPLSGKKIPANLNGKVVDKETLKTAFKKYKELDIKKLGL